MLAGARARLERDGRLAERVTLVSGEAERLPFAAGEFDHLTFTYLLRYVEDPAATMRELARVVRPGGHIASLEFAVPTAPSWRALWRLYTHVGLPSLGRIVSREWAQTGRFLARSIPDFYARHPVERVAEMWKEADIREVQVRRMSLGGGLVMWGTRGPGTGDGADRPAGDAIGVKGAAGVEGASRIEGAVGEAAWEVVGGDGHEQTA
jgi:demethylmenaquinone methyltransferase/2-methoxy-6-polyprenyl-1,4-benzoquinol methylase